MRISAHRSRPSVASLRDAAVSFVFPPMCAECGERGAWVCRWCVGELALFEPPWCARCGGNPCLCAALADTVDCMRAVGPHAGWLRAAIQALKYHGETARAAYLGDLLRLCLVDIMTVLPGPWVIVPVPLHPSRFRRRGYNQAELLTRRFSEPGPPIIADALRRVRATPHQVGLSPEQRRTNVTQAFTADPRIVAGHSVLLVDDVFTTGSTIAACADAARVAGASAVGAIVLSRGE